VPNSASPLSDEVCHLDLDLAEHGSHSDQMEAELVDAGRTLFKDGGLLTLTCSVGIALTNARGHLARPGRSA
jgi:hypothetical protein